MSQDVHETLPATPMICPLPNTQSVMLTQIEPALAPGGGWRCYGWDPASTRTLCMLEKRDRHLVSVRRWGIAFVRLSPEEPRAFCL